MVDSIASSIDKFALHDYDLLVDVVKYHGCEQYFILHHLLTRLYITLNFRSLQTDPGAPSHPGSRN